LKPRRSVNCSNPVAARSWSASSIDGSGLQQGGRIYPPPFFCTIMEPNQPPGPNPYSAPASAAENGTFSHQSSSGAWVRQVRVLAVLMCVQGALEFLFGIYFVVMGFVFPGLMNQQGLAPSGQLPAEQVETFSNVMFAFFVVAGLVVTFVGILRFVAGILGFHFRGRGLGIASHFLGLCSVVGIYCGLTAFALCLYGCLVYYNPNVRTAFRMRNEGQSVDEILAHFR